MREDPLLRQYHHAEARRGVPVARCTMHNVRGGEMGEWARGAMGWGSREGHDGQPLRAILLLSKADIAWCWRSLSCTGQTPSGRRAKPPVQTNSIRQTLPRRPSPFHCSSSSWLRALVHHDQSPVLLIRPSSCPSLLLWHPSQDSSPRALWQCLRPRSDPNLPSLFERVELFAR